MNNVVDPGDGWVLLEEGTPLKKGDGFLHPDCPDCWIDFECRPDIFRGSLYRGGCYSVPKKDYVHTWPWRRKLSEAMTPFEMPPEVK